MSGVYGVLKVCDEFSLFVFIKVKKKRNLFSWQHLNFLEDAFIDLVHVLA